MKLSMMREFIRLAANQNYSRTAEELYMAQPVLSRHIAAIEEELRVKLIHRTKNSFELTPEGKIVLTEFHKILNDYENLLEKLVSMDKEIEGELRIGVLYYDMNYYVSKIREVFKERYPRVKLLLKSYQPEQMEQDLLTGKIDAAFVYGVDQCPRRDIEHVPFLRIPYSLIYDKSHPLAQVKDLQFSDLDGEKLLVPEVPLEISRSDIQLSRMLNNNGVHISAKIPINNYDEVPWILKDTGAVYISPMANNTAYGPDAEYRFLQPELYACDISVVWLKENRSPAIELLLGVIKMCYS